jgi:hypothetical protein
MSKQIIDMGGFKNEEIEVRFGPDKYIIPLDPPIEAYRLILQMRGMKLRTEKDWDQYKNVVATIICKANPEVNKKQFIKSLTRVAATRFLEPYADILFKKRGDSKNPRSRKKRPGK